MQTAIKTVLDFIWGIIITIVRHPLFWLVLVVWVAWYIGTHPGEPVQYCPSCGQVR